MEPFVHLSARSFYSLLRGTSAPREIVRHAASLDAAALALTDHRSLAGALPFLNAARDAGIHPVFGASFPTPTPGAELTVLARNNAGYGALCRIVTDDRMARPKPGAREARLALAKPPSDEPLLEIVLRHARDIVCIVSEPACMAPLSDALGRDAVFAELFRPGTTRARRLERQVDAEARRLGLRAVATARAHFPTPADRMTHRLLSAIRTLKTIDTLGPEDVAPAACHLASPEEMARRFRDRPDALRITAQIADSCRVEFPTGRRCIPRVDPPEGRTCEEHLRHLCREAIPAFYPPEARPAATARLRYELDIICDMGYAPYFLAVGEIARYIREKGVPATGRGSAADSLVAYLMGFTHVDPIEHNLYFERFLNPARSSPPDIDIDLCWRRRDDVVDYVYRRWGPEYVAMISTHVTLSGRSAVREAGKAMGLSEAELSRYTRHLPHLGSVDFAAIQRERPEARELDLDAEPLRSLVPMAKAIEGLPTHLGVHPSGIVVSPEPLTDWVPLEYAAKGLVVTQYDMYPIEDLGLLKIDLLGQRSLSVIADASNQIRRERDPAFRFHKIDSPPNPDAPTVNPEHDKAAQDLIASGRTLGVFQIESPAMRGVLRKVRARDFETVTAASSVIRPGPKDSGMLRSWVRRHTGREPAQYLHPRLKEVLSETHGIVVYQEDVLKVVQAIAGMSLARADQIRRAMSDKRPDEPLTEMEGEFLEGARKNGVSPAAAREIWRQVRAFGGYAFCKAHSASYTVLSFQSAWLKAHYPAEFMAAVLANGGGYYDRAAYVSEARRLGLRVLPPSINESGNAWTGRDDWVRCGLEQIKSMGENSVRAILQARAADGPFRSFADALGRLRKVGPSDWERIVRCGACDGLNARDIDTEPASRPQLLWQLDRWFDRARKRGNAEQLDLLRPEDAPVRGDEGPPPLPDFSEDDRFDDELRILEVAVTRHPLRRYRALMPDPKTRPVIAARDLADRAGQRVRLVGWLVTSRRYRTAQGTQMKFLCLEDRTDIYEATLFDAAYRRYGHLTLTRGPYLLEGRAEEEDGNVTLNIERLELLRG